MKEPSSSCVVPVDVKTDDNDSSVSVLLTSARQMKTSKHYKISMIQVDVQLTFGSQGRAGQVL